MGEGGGEATLKYAYDYNFLAWFFNSLLLIQSIWEINSSALHQVMTYTVLQIKKENITTNNKI